MWTTAIIATTAAAIGLVLGAGWWRAAFSLFGIRKSRMTVAQLGLHVSQPARIERVNSVLAAFADGFNTMIASAQDSTWRIKAAAMPTVLQPFAEEGGAMGYIPRRLMRYSAARFEHEFPLRSPQFRYLYYVGLGFWAGMRSYSPAAMERLTRDLDPLYRYLCYDGFGFKHAFFDLPRRTDGLAPLDRLEGYARCAAYQGVGRALWFFHMDDTPGLVARLRGLGDMGEHAAAGLGLAAVFTFPDELQASFASLAALPAEFRPGLSLGMCFGLKARATTDRGRFTLQVQSLPAPRAEAISASIDACDFFEEQVRRDGALDGYRRWREAVTAWLESNVVFPMAAFEPSSSTRPPHSAAAAVESDHD